MLAALRSQGKQTFICSNSEADQVEVVMKATLGEEWHNFFDLCLIKSRKPLMYRAKANFYAYDSSKNE
jgi:fatty-acid desaturase